MKHYSLMFYEYAIKYTICIIHILHNTPKYFIYAICVHNLNNLYSRTYTVRRIVYGAMIQCTLYSVRRTVYAVQCTPYSVRRTVYDVHITTALHACWRYTRNNTLHRCNLLYLIP